ncbi:hypothetical protein HYU13_05050 [Candidatus Woesearchaeota archaeon]|nr:hypothetical protein [Candidatus Woesearchaeota archaeon]
MIKLIKEKLVGWAGSISSAASILGSWQICHNICLGLISLLSIIGITVAGMPLLFLTTIAIPMWTIALGIFIITLWLYLSKKCISPKLLLLNAGLIIAGTPFPQVQAFQIYFWTIGGLIAAGAAGWYLKDRIAGKITHHKGGHKGDYKGGKQ